MAENSTKRHAFKNQYVSLEVNLLKLCHSFSAVVILFNTGTTY